MFGYRVTHDDSVQNMTAPDVSQKHKPISQFTKEVIAELSQMYSPIPYVTKKKIHNHKKAAEEKQKQEFDTLDVVNSQENNVDNLP